MSKVVRLNSRVVEIMNKEGRFPENETDCLERLLNELMTLRASTDAQEPEEENVQLPVVVRRKVKAGE
jgi:hypothetical protein